MSNLKRDIEELLEDMPNAWCVDCEHPICLDKKELATTQIINLIESVADEIIGADNVDETDGSEKINSIDHIRWITIRNLLRAEQRDIKSKLIGKE